MTDLFDDLFVLELANNHNGSLERGKRLIDAFSAVVKENGVKAAIKLQLRNVDTLIHESFRDRNEIRYIKRMNETKMSHDDYRKLADHIRASGCLLGATPFDEWAVDFCVTLGVDFMKVASSNVDDTFLVDAISNTLKPTIVSTGGTQGEALDRLVEYFDRRSIPLAINHCVSLYPTKPTCVSLGELDELKMKYPGHVIGLSTHENISAPACMLMAYAKGARTFERHIDIDEGDYKRSPYCASPEELHQWFRAFVTAQAMCKNRTFDIASREDTYLATLKRGVYAGRAVYKGDTLEGRDIYFAIPRNPCQAGPSNSISFRKLTRSIERHQPICVGDLV